MGKITVKVHLKSVLRDSYDTMQTAAKADVEVNKTDKVLDFKAKALAALGEFTELRDVHHTQCRFVGAGARIIGPEDDDKTLAEIGLTHECEVHVVLHM